MARRARTIANHVERIHTVRIPGTGRTYYVPPEIRDLAARHDDEASRAVAADWLEEQGDVARAFFLRLGSSQVRDEIVAGKKPQPFNAELFLGKGGDAGASLRRIELPSRSLEVWGDFRSAEPRRAANRRIIIRNMNAHTLRPSAIDDARDVVLLFHDTADQMRKIDAETIIMHDGEVRLIMHVQLAYRAEVFA